MTQGTVMPLWELEPDHVLTESHGFVIEIKRHPTLGHLCGYVYIEDGNLAGWCNAELGVHGGWTYEDVQDGVHILGFDCGHAGDKSPYMDAHRISPYGDVYRDIPFVLNELKRVTRQLADKLSATSKEKANA